MVTFRVAGNVPVICSFPGVALLGGSVLFYKGKYNINGLGLVYTRPGQKDCTRLGTMTQVRLPVDRQYLQRTMTQGGHRRRSNITGSYNNFNLNFSGSIRGFFGDKTGTVSGFNVTFTRKQTQVRVTLRPYFGVVIVLWFLNNRPLGFTRVVFSGLVCCGQIVFKGRGIYQVRATLRQQNRRHTRVQVVTTNFSISRLRGAVTY